MTINGADDAPDIMIDSGDSDGLTLTESSERPVTPDGAFTTDGDTAVTTGTLTFSDPDFSDTHTASVTAVSVGIGEVAPPSLTEEDLLGLLHLSPLTDTVDGAGGSILYSFAGSENAFDYLADGESVTLTYTITVDDGDELHIRRT